MNFKYITKKAKGKECIPAFLAFRCYCWLTFLFSRE